MIDGDMLDENMPDQSGDRDERLALDTLRTVCLDPNAPAAARAGAARTILEAKQVIGRHATLDNGADNKPLSTLSRADLEAELARLSQPKR